MLSHKETEALLKALFPLSGEIEMLLSALEIRLLLARDCPEDEAVLCSLIRKIKNRPPAHPQSNGLSPEAIRSLAEIEGVDAYILSPADPDGSVATILYALED